MGLNSTPSANRVHIGFFGRRNAGKSSVVNAVTGQELAVVSDTKGTTTDPVYKSMELLPIGPVMIIDTPGFDDEGALGELRVRKTKQVLNKTDIAVLVVDATEGKKQCDEELIRIFKEKEIPYIIVNNKADLLSDEISEKVCQNNVSEQRKAEQNALLSSGQEQYVSALTGAGIYELKECIGKLTPNEDMTLKIVGDLLHPGDFVVLVVPIDSAAPKGRLILPQQQTIRDVLEANAAAIVVKESELKQTLEQLGRSPAMVITDSQVFEQVSEEVSKEIPLTSFSILMARYKGYLETAVNGVAAIDHLKDGDKILISEGCTHHRQCDDIGTVKIPRWLKQHTGKDLIIETSSGTEFPEDLTSYALVIHCGGCMLNEREVKYRMKCAEDQKVPFTNYGIAIAQMKGILKRSIELFPNGACEQ
ncbi:[FeFe] hydrogenase H-cluster maturation GTPase HydF [Eubacterium ramulus]|uniref:[FeFe] hydrogenase H-cluster maturation GTPase HydF n=1 Tax=Eubacterium ramulus TaxID=39490 RepID=A0A844E696_EUBRA|nr:[FeFe] hydrogenase H-cluster maturation GTPase HydF [Eubacterium ramulus]MSD17108.1 [FeFe] hydrogenase H-cluster maturation GTPase HydF [Eubacterium ramulus]